jgi:Mrp family chromosome partitioning ATPase
VAGFQVTTSGRFWVIAKEIETLRRVDAPIRGIVLNESAIATGALAKAYAGYKHRAGRRL